MTDDCTQALAAHARLEALPRRVFRLVDMNEPTPRDPRPLGVQILALCDTPQTVAQVALLLEMPMPAVLIEMKKLLFTRKLRNLAPKGYPGRYQVETIWNQ